MPEPSQNIQVQGTLQGVDIGWNQQVEKLSERVKLIKSLEDKEM